MKLLGAQVGRPAPDFKAVTLGGEDIRLSDYRGKVVLVDFWATWCSPCVAEIPNITEAWDKHGKGGLVVISVSFDSDAATVRRFWKRKPMPWTHVLAEDAERSDLAKSYGVAGIPATFLIGPDGKVVAKDLRGRRLVRRISEEVAKLKPPGKPVAVQPPDGDG